MKQFTIVFFCTLIFFLFANGVQTSEGQSHNTILKDSRSAEAIVAELSDEQARRLLIGELKKDVLAEVLVSKTAKNELGKLAGFIDNIKNKVTLIQERIEFLRSGGTSDKHTMHVSFSSLRKSDSNFMSTRSIFSVLSIFLLGYSVELLFRWYSSPFRGRIMPDAHAALRGKIGRLSLWLCIDIISTLIFIVAVILSFYLFFERTHALLMTVAAYLSAIVAVRILLIISRFFLSPKDPCSRFLPINNAVTLFLYRWIAAISIFSSFGLMTCGLLGLVGVSEAVHIKSISLIALVITGMLITMILQKRKEVILLLCAKLPVGSQAAKLMKKWHHFAIFSVFLFFILSISNTVLGKFSGVSSIKTLLMIPLYFLMDWILGQILEVLFGFIPKKEEPTIADMAGDDSSIKKPDRPQKKSLIKQVEFSRMKASLISSLRIALAVLVMIWTLNISFLWATLPVGRI
ncbi:MAG: hypothetical protein L3J69_20075 [Desulfobacula sp.]|nr:hypothetical protein [Desulfobacula sp.]